MHVLTRGVDEGVVIDDEIRVMVLEINENFVRLGITVPNEEPSYREQIVYLDQANEAELYAEPMTAAVAGE